MRCGVGGINRLGWNRKGGSASLGIMLILAESGKFN